MDEKDVGTVKMPNGNIKEVKEPEDPDTIAALVAAFTDYDSDELNVRMVNGE